MPLEEIVGSLEGISEEYHDLYVEGDDGKYKIDISGLKSAIQKERLLRKKLEKQVKKDDNVPPDVVALTTELAGAKNMIKDMKIQNKVKTLALEAGVSAEYVDDVLTLTKQNFSLDEEGQVIMVDNKGEALEKSVDSFFKNDFKSKKPLFYVNTGRTGSGSHHNLGSEFNTAASRERKAAEKKDTKELIKLKMEKIRR